MVTQSLNLRKFSVKKKKVYCPYTSDPQAFLFHQQDIFHWKISPPPTYISSNDMNFRLNFLSPNSLVVSHMLKIFATTPGKVLHSVVKERVLTPTHSTGF
jgi:hypothetical protein